MKASQLLNHPQLGLIELRMRRGSVNVSARWSHDRLIVTIPTQTDPLRLYDVINSMATRLMARKPKPAGYIVPSAIELPDAKFILGRQSIAPESVTARIDGTSAQIGVGTAIDPTSTSGAATISKMLVRCASRMAPAILLPRARALAAQLGLHPAAWSISAGHRILGRCSVRGEIALSRDLVFLPQHLRDYIVWHELAHLSEMNHSPKFHALCDAYCSGREKALAAELRRYPWPIIR